MWIPKKFREIGTKVLGDKTPITITISITQLWVLIGGIQLATKHPRLPKHTKDHLTHIGRELEQPLIRQYPEVKELIERGWKGS
jgi:hypothetical protein